MEFSDLIYQRKSIRWYLDKDVPNELIYKIITEASRAPSFMNHQPWEVSIAKDNTLKKIIELYDTDRDYQPSIPWPPKWPPRHQKLIDENRIAAGKRILPESGIGKWNYNAPVILYLHIHRDLNEWSIFDLGSFSQTLMLSAANLGLSSVPQARLILHEDKTRKILNLSEERKLILGITLGYGDMNHSNNQIQTKRDDITNWVNDAEKID